MPPQTHNHPSVKLVDLYEYLKRFSLSDSLFLIGKINCAFKAGINKLSPDNIDPRIIGWLEGMDIDTRRQVLIHSSRLARCLLLYGSNDYKDEV